MCRLGINGPLTSPPIVLSAASQTRKVQNSVGITYSSSSITRANGAANSIDLMSSFLMSKWKVDKLASRGADRQKDHRCRREIERPTQRSRPQLQQFADWPSCPQAHE